MVHAVWCSFVVQITSVISGKGMEMRRYRKATNLPVVCTISWPKQFFSMSPFL